MRLVQQAEGHSAYTNTNAIIQVYRPYLKPMCNILIVWVFEVEVAYFVTCSNTVVGVVWCGVVWCGVVWCDVVCCGCTTRPRSEAPNTKTSETARVGAHYENQTQLHLRMHANAGLHDAIHLPGVSSIPDRSWLDAPLDTNLR